MIGEILIPALSVGGIGLFFGGLLAYASIVFHVQSDERLDQVTEALPGANCGGCGYAGCSAFAKAVVEDGVEITRCNLMTAEKAGIIAGIMGITAGAVVKKTARVACRGTCGVAPDKYEYYGLEDCVTAVQLGGGPKKCEFGCMGLGSCVKVCAFDAIHIMDGVAQVDESLCTGCGACAGACPKGIIHMVPSDKQVFVGCSSREKGVAVKNDCDVGCIACKLCEKKCMFDAVHVVDNIAAIDPAK